MSEIIPAFAAAWAGIPGDPTRPVIEAMLTIAPPPRAFRCGTAAFVTTNAVRRSCASCSSQAATEVSSSHPPDGVPDPGVVHEDVEAAEPLDHYRHRCAHVRLDGHVAGDRQTGRG